MQRNKSRFKKPTMPFSRGQQSGRTAEQDLALWLPALFHNAFGRSAGKYPSLTDDELFVAGRAVQALSRGFTGDRSLAGVSYFHERASLAAYLLYYWPVSYMQARALFSRLLPPDFLRRADVLDAGSGPGPLAAAALDCGAKHVTAVDSSREAIGLARSIANARGYEIETGRLDLVKGGGPPTGDFRVILLGHVLNELWPGRPGAVARRADRVEELAARLAVGGRIVILEPALLSVTRELLTLRDELVGRGYPVFAPCLRQGSCPCLADHTSTCHTDYPWDPPSYFVRLAHRARLGRESLRFAALVIGRPGDALPDRGPDTFRVVSERMLAKSGRLRYIVCNERGRFTLSAKPQGNERWARTFMGLKRWDVVRVENTEEREKGLGLLPGSGLEKVELRMDVDKRG
jgi:hypothetical protein